MALLQISEPGQAPAPHQRKLAVGIDLGTTNSLVASVRSGTAETLPDVDGQHILPSVVRYLDDGQRQVGREAKAAVITDPLNTLQSVKRMMGRGVEDVATLGEHLPYQFSDREGMASIVTVAGDISPVQASADILQALAQRGRDTLGDELQGAVITVPAYFDEAQRQATKDAATLAGLKVLRLLNEPTAAAVAYGLDSSDEGVVAIYDLGGGTFDISVLRLTQGVFEVLATGGDSALGGDDFDRAIGEWVIQQSGVDVNTLTPQQLRELSECSRDAKEALSAASCVELQWCGWQGDLSREQLNGLLDPLIELSVRACKRALRDAKIKVADIDNVVLVGGSTRALRVRERVEQFFAQPPLTDIDPDRVVAIGAALQADVLVGNKSSDEMLLLDVIPLSLGIETMGGLMEKIIPRNTTIPVARAQEFTTYKDGQTAMSIHVLQGEREMIADCRSLAKFELRDIPPMVAGAAHIRVTFQVDADGLLSVSAQETSTGHTASVEIKPSYGLDDSAITNMLKASYTHAKEDMLARALREQQVEGQRTIELLAAAIAADKHLLDEQELRSFEQAMTELRHLTDVGSAEQITAQISVLGQLTEPFAARRMNQSINQALAGKSIDDVE